MTTAISTNVDAELPVHEDGTRFRYAFVTPGGVALFADTISELVAEMIPGYAALPDTDQTNDPAFEARLDTLTTMAAQCQATIVVSAEADGAELDEDELTALLTPKDGPVLEFETWESKVPLLLFATNYQPFTTVPRPTGEHLVWLSAYTETEFLQSLELLGAGEQHTTDEDD